LRWRWAEIRAIIAPGEKQRFLGADRRAAGHAGLGGLAALPSAAGPAAAGRPDQARRPDHRFFERQTRGQRLAAGPRRLGKSPKGNGRRRAERDVRADAQKTGTGARAAPGQVKILGASPEAFNYAGGFERLDERSEL